MTTLSFMIAIGLSVVVASLLGWLLCRSKVSASLAANWSLGSAVALAIPALLSDHPRGMIRMLWPREAIDWLPMATLCLVAIMTVILRFKNASKVALIVGSILCMGLAYRFLYGSIYLRPTKIEAINLIAIAGWGLALSASWLIATLDRSKDASRSWLQAIASLLVLAAVAVSLGMSGSFTYCAIGLIATAATLATWTTTARVPAFAFFIATSLLGLGYAYAELWLISAILLGIAVIMVSIDASGHLGSYRLPILCIAAILALVVAGETFVRFQAKLSEKSKSNGGYESYK